MIREINRREWLKAGSLLAGSLLLPQIKVNAKPVFNGFTGEWIFQDGPDPRIKIRLMFNENPYGPSVKAIEALKRSLYRSNLYPFDLAQKLKTKIAAKHGLSEENVLLGSGSTELLILAGVISGVQGGSVLSAYPSFESLMRSAVALKGNWKQVPLDADHKHDLKKMESAVDGNTRMVYVCNPNNPTGTLLDNQELISFCKRVSSKAPVFVDEAYNDFLDEPEQNTVIGLINDGYQVLVARTFSKIHAFAGLRVGYLLGPPDLLAKMVAFRHVLTTLSTPSISAALASLKDTEFLNYCHKKNNEVKSFTYKSLNDIGYKYVPSHTSFMVFEIGQEPKFFIEQMLKSGIGIRTWTYMGKNWCRVSIGKMEEMQKFVERLEEIT